MNQAKESLYINGQWIAGEGESIVSIDPGNGESLWQGRGASVQQVDQAVQAARAAFPAWRDAPLAARITLLQAFAAEIKSRQTELATLISRENGKPLWDAQTEVAAVIGKIASSIEAFQQRTGAHQKNTAQGELILRHKPHGVVAVFGPFNFPVHLPNGHIVPALLAGNCVLFKPSELTPAVAEFTLRCWQAAGLPPGVLNCLQGSRETGAALVNHPQLDGLFFTGSAQTGHYLHQQWGGQPHKILALEMGGNNPLIVEPVRDINAALFTVLFSAFVSSGQRCTCARRLLLPDSAWGDDFFQQLTQRSSEISVAYGLSQPPPFMGSVISSDAARHLQDGIRLLESLGGDIRLAPRFLNTQQTLMTPALIDMSRAQQMLDEELFGPVLQVFRYRDRDHAIELANATRFGLAAGLISDDTAAFEHVERHLRAGIVNFNKPLTGASSEAPFGGIGASGNHRPSAFYAADYCAYPVATLRSDSLQLPVQLPPGLPACLISK
ncbi:MAG TPA: succinylglutamate-semialdehyde dehydrogenase [Dongiaceae bacterium]|nr:succinylglutamate-semialdehyde dehydrogenase [Dongiaceae bacterium]